MQTGGFLHFQYSRLTVVVKDDRPWTEVSSGLERLIRFANLTASGYAEPCETKPAVERFLDDNCTVPPKDVFQVVCAIDGAVEMSLTEHPLIIRVFPCGLDGANTMITVQHEEAQAAGLPPLRLCYLSQNTMNEDRFFL